MRVLILVCGGTDFCDYSLLRTKLDQIMDEFENDEVEIVTGHAKGADSLAEKYAAEKNLFLKIFPAEWNKYGKSAGIIRNKTMLSYIETAEPVVVAFWDGESPGTGFTVKEARKREIDTRVINY